MSESPRDFCGTARLFPLPNLVLFPHVVQPLHVFEARYRQMTADALAGDGLIAVVTLKADEDEAADRPAVESVACVGRIIWHEEFPDGRYNLRALTGGGVHAACAAFSNIKVSIGSELEPARIVESGCKYRDGGLAESADSTEQYTACNSSLPDFHELSSF